MRHSYFCFKKAVVTLLISLSAFAGDYQFLVRRTTRPTMQEIFPYLNEIPGLSSVSVNTRKSQVFPFVERLVVGGPSLIANLEKAFPGATWAFIGRDSQLIGDMVEAFYFSIGQNHRVRRVGMSKPTLEKATDTGPLIQYLESLGLNARTIEKDPPFIFVDTISNGYGRQARAITSTFYDHFKRTQHKNPSVLIRKVNVVGLVVSTFQGARNDLDRIETLLSQEEARYAQAGDDFVYFDEHKIPTFPEPIPLFNESGYEHYTHAWHGSFGPFTVLPGNVVRATPGESSAAEIKEQILAMQAYIFRAVRQNDFKESVVEAAKKLGYDFPFKRLPPTQRAPTPAKYPKELIAIFKAGEKALKEFEDTNGEEIEALREMIGRWTKPQEKGESPTALTANGQELLAWFHQNRANYNPHYLATEMIAALRLGRKGLRLRSIDLQVIANEVFQTTIPNELLVREVIHFVDEAKAFSDMMQFGEWIQGKPGEATYEGIKAWIPHVDSCARFLSQAE